MKRRTPGPLKTDVDGCSQIAALLLLLVSVSTRCLMLARGAKPTRLLEFLKEVLFCFVQPKSSAPKPEQREQAVLFVFFLSFFHATPRCPPQTSLRLQLDEVESNLKDPRRFGDALAILQTQDFQKRDIKRVFNAYSDNSTC